ncbi:hypothetical protein C2845_PM14G16860 [Panicum miliaceum]|uniref:DUF6598 domain-containing protein n=1 Tax=Panicum miliaceum TaxID=4540 RepID=A0A3L6PLP1_PANMI|nr:hypothetical protein C2845_PM14G16860 [Panicum miliaceum]
MASGYTVASLLDMAASDPYDIKLDISIYDPVLRRYMLSHIISEPFRCVPKVLMVVVLIYVDLHFGLRCTEHRRLFYAYGRRRYVMTMGWAGLSGGGGLEMAKRWWQPVMTQLRFMLDLVSLCCDGNHRKDSLIEMTGPKRCILMESVVLIDMRIKNGVHEEDDLQLIDGALSCSCHAYRAWRPVRNRITGSSGTSDVSLAVVEQAVEATIEVVISQVLSGLNLSLSSFVDVMDVFEEIQLFDGTIGQSGALRRFVLAVSCHATMLLKLKRKWGGHHEQEHWTGPPVTLCRRWPPRAYRGGPPDVAAPAAGEKGASAAAPAAVEKRAQIRKNRSDLPPPHLVPGTEPHLGGGYLEGGQ